MTGLQIAFWLYSAPLNAIIKNFLYDGGELWPTPWPTQRNEWMDTVERIGRTSRNIPSGKPQRALKSSRRSARIHFVISRSPVQIRPSAPKSTCYFSITGTFCNISRKIVAKRAASVLHKSWRINSVAGHEFSNNEQQKSFQKAVALCTELWYVLWLPKRRCRNVWLHEGFAKTFRPSRASRTGRAGRTCPGGTAAEQVDAWFRFMWNILHARKNMISWIFKYKDQAVW